MKNIAVVILAAGKSTRMKSLTPKALHHLCGRPILGYVLDLAKEVNSAKTVVVLGYGYEQVRKILPAGVEIAVQKKLIGTADAVKCAYPALKNFKGTVLVLYADNPLLKKETVKKLLQGHIDAASDVTLLTANVDKPVGYGRILRDEYSAICGIVEERDADEFEKEIKEINTGIACFKSDKLFAALKKVRPNNRKKEYYLTDAIGIIYKNNGLIGSVKIDDVSEAQGINSRIDLARANKIQQRRVNEDLMKKGVTIIDPETTFISFGSKVGAETVIYPFTVIENDVKIGKRCSVGPFAHLREGTNIDNDVLAGNFLEIVRSTLGSKTFIKHFSYIGDSRIGKSVNIGAGTVTANFDGKKKNFTIIKDNALIGSDTILVAPAKIGKNSVTGAGSVIVKNIPVPDNAIVVGVPARQLKIRKK
ncbi:MAG: NTP transferase domain-containing protein [Candidatus Omnitrophica bacterium]|jgi:bifunctional UDP-N-acetylglucosamine pyrophosphorylase/glucosamine-1-phosphate N-acetyltransferase|nr:NTP transferase domain-containing protein [Candidatus Omnitrophota bacterium]